MPCYARPAQSECDVAGRKKKHEKTTYTLNVHRHKQATRIGWDERKSQQPCRHDGEGVFASLIPWQIQKGEHHNLAALNQDWPKQMAHDMVYWYWLLIWIWCSYICIDIDINTCNKCWTNCLDVGIGFIWDLPVWVKCYRNQVRDPKRYHKPSFADLTSMMLGRLWLE